MIFRIAGGARFDSPKGVLFPAQAKRPGWDKTIAQSADKAAALYHIRARLLAEPPKGIGP
jgi:hypothetical protein